MQRRNSGNSAIYQTSIYVITRCFPCVCEKYRCYSCFKFAINHFPCRGTSVARAGRPLQLLATPVQTGATVSGVLIARVFTVSFQPEEPGQRV
jgi:hypothetical protein